MPSAPGLHAWVDASMQVPAGPLARSIHLLAASVAAPQIERVLW